MEIEMSAADYRRLGREIFYRQKKAAVGEFFLWWTTGIVMLALNWLGPAGRVIWHMLEIGGRTYEIEGLELYLITLANATPALLALYLAVRGFQPTMRLRLVRANLEMCDGKNVILWKTPWKMEGFWKNLWLVCLMELIITLWGIPGFTMAYLGIMARGALGSAAVVISGAGLILMVALPVRAAIEHALAMHVLAEEPDLTAHEAIETSKRMLEGHKWEFFCLQMSFIGWTALGIVTLGLTQALYAGPYEMAATAVFYRARAGEYREREAAAGNCKAGNEEGKKSI